MEYTEDTNKSDGIVFKTRYCWKNKAYEGEIITITVNKVQKTVNSYSYSRFIKICSTSS